MFYFPFISAWNLILSCIIYRADLQKCYFQERRLACKNLQFTFSFKGIKPCSVILSITNQTSNERRYAKQRTNVFHLANKWQNINRSCRTNWLWRNFHRRSSIQFSRVVEFSNENRSIARCKFVEPREEPPMTDRLISHYPGKRSRCLYPGRARFCGQFTCWCKKFRSKIASPLAEREAAARVHLRSGLRARFPRSR